ncbi:MAG: DolP-mannose mannosyltransferase [Blastocatellia bacterium]
MLRSSPLSFHRSLSDTPAKRVSTPVPVQRIASLFTDRRIFWALVVLSVAFYCQYQFWRQPCGQDRSIWDYFAQEIARGGAPYRDVVDIKTPFSAYIGAAVLLIARPFGIQDVLAIRVAWLLVSSIAVGLVFLVASRSFNKVTAVMAAAIMLSFEHFSISNSAGIEPKTLVVAFGLSCLWAIQSKKSLLSGLFGMLAALTWQPGLLYVGVAFLASSHLLTRPFSKEATRTLAGAALPLFLLLLHLFLLGALRDFYHWTILFNFSVYAPRGLRTLSGFVRTLDRDISQAYTDQRLWFVLAAIGFLLSLLLEAIRFRERRTRLSPDSISRDTILLSALIYLLFCMINIQGPDDLIPLLPYVAIFAAVAIIQSLDSIADLLFQLMRRPAHPVIKQTSYVLILCWISFNDAASAFAYQLNGPHLEEQILAAREITSHLAPGDKVYAHGNVQLLVLSGLRNAERHVLLDRGKDTFMDRVEPGGFASWFASLKDKRPKIVVLARLKNVDRGHEFKTWIENEYEVRNNGVYEYFLRKQNL